MDDKKVLYTYAAVMEIFGVSMATVKRWVRDGRLEVKKYGRCARVTADSIRRQLDQ